MYLLKNNGSWTHWMTAIHVPTEGQWYMYLLNDNNTCTCWITMIHIPWRTMLQGPKKAHPDMRLLKDNDPCTYWKTMIHEPMKRQCHMYPRKSKETCTYWETSYHRLSAGCAARGKSEGERSKLSSWKQPQLSQRFIGSGRQHPDEMAQPPLHDPLALFKGKFHCLPFFAQLWKGEGECYSH